MSVEHKPPPEGDGQQQGDAGAATGDNGQGDGQQGQPQGGSAGKTFTQQELETIISERIARERGKYSDYDELKAQAQRLAAIEEGQKTELQKAQDAAAKAEQKRQATEARASGLLRRAAILSEAAKQNADGDIVAAMLAADESIKVGDDGEVTGAKEAVAKLLKDKPAVALIQTPGRTGGEFGGNDQAPIAERIKQLESKGDRQSLEEARALKIAGLVGRPG